MAAAGELVLTEELKPKQRQALADLLKSFARWSEAIGHMRHTDLAEMILEESGYTEMWQMDRSAEAPGRLENLKELINNMGEYESLAGFLEHVSLVMDADGGEAERGGLHHDAAFRQGAGVRHRSTCPAGRKGCSPRSARSTRAASAGLEEERRLAYVGLTRARKNAKIWFVSNRRMHGLWQSTMPSRFLDDLPEDACRGLGAGELWRLWRRRHGRLRRLALRHDGAVQLRLPHARLAARAGQPRGADPRKRVEREPVTIEGELVARSVIGGEARFSRGDRVFHQKFGAGHGGGGGRQQADGGFRQGRAEAGGGQFRRGGLRRASRFRTPR